jgi:hypothetical protein
MSNLKSFDIIFQKLICAIILLFYTNTFSAQSQSENLLQGTWKLQQVISSKQKKDLTLNIKYSNDYNRYFGNITIYGDVTTLDNIKFDAEKRVLEFSSHIRNKNSFALTINNDKIEGTVSGSEIDYDISGIKTSSSNSTKIKEYGTYERTKLPNNIKDFYLETGNTSSDIVLLIVQGGPYEEMQYTINQFKKWANKLHIIFIKQAQIINPTILPPENNLTLEDAYYENLISVEMLHKTIQNFKEENKKVLVWGVSYGAWVIQKYIAEYGIGADAVSIAAGRLDLETVIWTEGKMNQKVFDITYKNDERIYNEMGFTYTKPTSYLLASIDEERYTELLSKKDLSKLVVYQYGKNDGTVGRLSESEIDFLKIKDVEIEVCNKCYHRQMLSEKIMDSAIQKMVDFVNKK